MAIEVWMAAGLGANPEAGTIQRQLLFLAGIPSQEGMKRHGGVNRQPQYSTGRIILFVFFLEELIYGSGEPHSSSHPSAHSGRCCFYVAVDVSGTLNGSPVALSAGALYQKLRVERTETGSATEASVGNVGVPLVGQVKVTSIPFQDCPHKKKVPTRCTCSRMGVFGSVSAGLKKDVKVVHSFCRTGGVGKPSAKMSIFSPGGISGARE